MRVGAPKKYDAKGLERAVKRYFKSISREVKLTEKIPTGQKDEMGHMIFEDREVVNALGKPVVVTEYLVPPTVGGLSDYLGIHRDTWNDYCNHTKHPEFSDTTTYAQGRIHAYLERESLTRQGKDLKGVLFNLENNFGYKERLEMSNETVEGYLQKILESEEGQQF